MSEQKICPAAGKCGGCTFQGIPYEEQLQTKLNEVKKCFIANQLDPQLVSDIEACPVRENYRNKMEFTFGNEVKDGPMLLGMHKKGSFMSVCDASDCSIVPEDFTRVLKLTKEFCLEKGYVHYHKKFHKGLLRSLILRQGIRTKELLINLVTSSEVEFAEEEWKELLLGADLEAKIVGILHTINDDPADAVNVTELKVLYGDTFYMEEIMGLKFKVGAFSFFQTNVAAAERLYMDALALIPGIEGKTVYDLYCGTGTISQAMALKAKQVIGVEIVEEAVESARVNASLNGLTNCRFIADDVQHALSSIEEKPDVIVVDPPRSGMTPKALSQVLSYGVKEILYISCNPKTLAQNLRAAHMSGYKTVSCKAYDNFPYTSHTECIVLLSRA